MNLILNVIGMTISALVAAWCFKDGSPMWGTLNLCAAALNAMLFLKNC